MTSDQPESIPTPLAKPVMVKVENASNLYRLVLPGDKPEKPARLYYAVIKRGRKQFRPIGFAGSGGFVMKAGI